MKRRMFSDATLDEMRGIGDPKLDGLVNGLPPADAKRYFRCVATDGIDAAFQAVDPALKAAVTQAVEEDTTEALSKLDDFVLDPTTAITRARSLFSTYGEEISASLLLAALPHAYATAWGGRVLVAHGDLEWALPRRVRETAMFLASVLTDPGTTVGNNVVAPEDTIKATCAPLRLFHAMVREQVQRNAAQFLGARNQTPINQEDLLGTLLSFTVTTFEVVDQLGVHWTDGDREAYLLCWDVVGAALGIGTRTVRGQLAAVAPVPHRIRPRTVKDARRVIEQLRERQWLPFQNSVQKGRPFPWSELAPGRMLVDALLAALTDAMPPTKRTWPAIVIRELAPDVVRTRLGLEGTGLSSYATDWLAQRSGPVKAARGATLRMMANDVTRHATQWFLRADGPPFIIPGLDLHELTPKAAKRPNLELR